jgi:RimJ/RimL family protein N-acetyltransferase
MEVFMKGFLEGERIILRTLKKDDLDILFQLSTDKEVCDLIGEVYPITEGEINDYYDRLQKTDNRISFVVIDKEKNVIIGETGLLRIFAPWRTADLSIIIWDRNYWGKGYGKEIAKLIMGYAFNDINVHRLSIGVVGFHEGGLKFWKSVGFKEEGRQTEGYYKNGIYSDFIMMYILEDEYRNKEK